MKIEYVAFDSFGVKSSCIFVETKDVKIVVDPGIAAETNSFPLPLEDRLALVEKYKKRIEVVCSKADVIAISHYHYDHYQPIKNWYKNKILLIKDFKNKINKSQQNRAKQFLQKIIPVAKEIKIADNNKFEFGNTEIKFSIPLWHGVKNTPLGHVLMTEISTKKEKLIHSSDIDGPSISSYADLIIKEKPTLLILDGAPTYLLGYIHAYYNLCLAILNLRRIIKSGKVKKIILDHHALRDYRYKEFYYLAFEDAKRNGVKLHTAAEEVGIEPRVLSGLKKYGKTKWKEWDKIREKNLKQILNNAEKNDLLESKDIEMIKKEII